MIPLPTWMEAAAAFWATAFLGAVVVPVVHFYGRKEVGYILDSVKPKAFIGMGKFGRLEFQPELTAAVPVVGVVGGDFGELDFFHLLAEEPLDGCSASIPRTPR